MCHHTARAAAKALPQQEQRRKHQASDNSSARRLPRPFCREIQPGYGEKTSDVKNQRMNSQLDNAGSIILQSLINKISLSRQDRFRQLLAITVINQTINSTQQQRLQLVKILARHAHEGSSHLGCFTARGSQYARNLKSNIAACASVHLGELVGFTSHLQNLCFLFKHDSDLHRQIGRLVISAHISVQDTRWPWF
nr:MAG TPA_asm: hypothetical protein [Caudoviricetes sp.]